MVMSPPGRWKRRKADVITTILRRVLTRRRFQSTIKSAIAPFISSVRMRTSIRRCGPKNAPSAPTSFQSPPPRLRISTNGSNSPRPDAVPSRDSLAPCQPVTSVWSRMAIGTAGYVSQLGMRRQRASVNPAVRANMAERIQMALFTTDKILGFFADYRCEKVSPSGPLEVRSQKSEWVAPSKRVSLMCSLYGGRTE
jgi:hypothetical protein